MANENTLVIIKPDAVAAGHAHAITQMIWGAGLGIHSWSHNVTLKLEAVERHYAEHRDRPFYADLCSFMTSGPVWIFVVQGDNAVARMRALVGTTDPNGWMPGTIRHRFGTSVSRNVIHASDSVASAEREIGNFFKSSGETI